MSINLNIKSSYKKGTLFLFQGNLWAQLLGFLGTFIVAKIYGADTIGVFSKFISLSSILAIFFTLRLESIFVLELHKKNDTPIFSTLVYNILIVGIISLLLCVITPDNYFTSINFLKAYVIFSILGGALKSLEATYLSYLLTKEKYKVIANSRVAFTIIRYAFQIALFYIIPSDGLIVGYMTSLAIIMLFLSLKSERLFTIISLARYFSTLKQHRNLVTYGVLSDNLNAINLHIIPIAAGIYFSNSEIGWYFLATVALSVPVTLIGTSFSKVFFLKASEVFTTNHTQLYSFVKKRFLNLTIILIPLFLLIFFFAKPLISIILGQEWESMGTYIQILCGLYFLRALYNPVSHLEEVLKKNHIGLLFNLFLLLGNLVAVYVAYQQQSFETLVNTIAVIFPLGYIAIIGYFFYYTYHLKNRFLK